MKAGYKQTEVGVIPEDWDCVCLGDIGDALIGLTYRPEDVCESGTLVLRSSNIQDDKLAFRDNVFVSMEVPDRIRVRTGDVLICVRNGSRELIGKSAYLDRSVEGMTFGAFMAIHRGRHGKLVSILFQSNILKRQIGEHLGATINQITNKSLKYFQVPLPREEAEQSAIATALSDVDALLAAQDALIAKKRAIKQGAMQELLTGKRRLPGFGGEWEVRRLDQLAEIRSGGTPSTSRPDFWDGDVLWVTPTDISALDGRKFLETTARKITELGLKASSAEIIPASSVVMTTRATIGECAINVVPLSTNQGFKNFVPRSSVDVGFLFYLLTTQKQGFIGLCTGSTFLEIGKAQLAGYEVAIPERDEQLAIAKVLSDMDTEITALETQRAKTAQLKQGMMQALLTGRIRLV